MNNNTDKYDVFLSYRRNGGAETAQLLYDRLTRKGYKVSFDLETLRSGKFDKQLNTRVEQCKDVIVIMSKGALEVRENPEDDWLRLEVKHALEHQKNIVPVFLRDFDRSEAKQLPQEDVLNNVCGYEGVTASHEHFDSTFAKLCRLLTAKPVIPWKRFGVIGVAILLLIAGVWGFAYRDHIVPWPFTTVEKQQLEGILYLVQGQGNCMHQLLSMQKQLLIAAKNALNSDSRSHFHDQFNVFMHDWNKMDIEQWKPKDEQMASARNCPVKSVDMQVIYDCLVLYHEESKEDAEYLRNYMGKDSAMTKSDLLEYIHIKEEYWELEVKLYSYYQMNLLHGVAPKALEEYKSVARRWTTMPLLAGNWERDQMILENLLDQCLNAMEEKINQIAVFVGNMNVNLRQEKKQFGELLVDSGATQEQANKMVENVMETESQKSELAEMQKKLEEARERVRQKFAPLESDDSGTLWGKGLRFMTVNMSDEALKCVDMLRKKNDPQFSTPVCNAAEAFIRQRSTLSFKSGVLVCFFEPPATSHAIYKIGDIVTHINDKPCANYKAYVATEKEKNRKMLIWRLDVNGKFVSHEAIMPENQPRVALINLAETLE